MEAKVQAWLTFTVSLLNCLVLWGTNSMLCACMKCKPVLGKILPEVLADEAEYIENNAHVSQEKSKVGDQNNL